MKPVTYLFPGVVDGRRVDAPASDKMVWHACRVAARRAIRDTTIYLHLSQKHLKAVANPLDEIPVSSSTALRGKVKRVR